MSAALVVVVVTVALMAALPVLVGLQGWLRDRARRATLEAFRARNEGILLVSTRRWPVADPGLAPRVLRANTVRCLDPTRLSLSSLRQLVGGEMKMFTRNFNLARDEATERLREEARTRGYDCVLNVRYETSQVSMSAYEVVAYGTAIRRAPPPKGP